MNIDEFNLTTMEEYLSDHVFERSGLLLRDFFIAHDGHTIQQAIISLKPYFSNIQNMPEADAATEWRNIEYDFNALFIGPKSPLAPPYASVYLDGNKLLLTEDTLEVRRFMQLLGLSVDSANNTPDDHIAFELELVVLLLLNMNKSDEYKEALKQYTQKHLDTWLPLFIEKIISGARTPVIKETGNVLFNWFNELKARTLS